MIRVDGTSGLVARGLSKSYHVRERFWVNGPGVARSLIKDLDVALLPGETVGLIGRTGAGKTTLARILAGLCPPDKGCVALDGSDLYRVETSRWRCLRSIVRYVFQNPDAALHSRMLVGQILKEALKTGDRSVIPRDGEEMSNLCARFLLQPAWLEQYPRQLSLGQRRRVALARGLANRPSYAIMDEPFSGLDLASKRALLRVLKSIHTEQKMAILLVSHDLDTVVDLCDRVLVMREGQIVEDLSRKGSHWDPVHDYTRTLFELSGVVPAAN